MKICTKCNESKEVIDYHFDNNSKDGFKTICKICCKKSDRESYIKRNSKYKKENGIPYNTIRSREENQKWKDRYGISKNSFYKWFIKNYETTISGLSKESIERNIKLYKKERSLI